MTNNNDFKSLHEQMQQLMKQVAEQQAEFAEQKAKHEALAESFDKEIKIREAIQMHIDGFVEEMLDKIRNLETKLVQLTENEAALLIHLSKEFRRGAYAIIKGTASAPVEERPSS